MEKLASGPGGTLNWFATNDESKIRPYFGSRSAWEKIPRDWDSFVFEEPSREPVLLDHGYDETKAPEEWQLSDLAAAAEFRGGKYLSDTVEGPYEPATWECANGHSFQMTPNLMLKGGHWCPTCMIDPETYGETARHSPFFAQVWTEEAEG